MDDLAYRFRYYRAALSIYCEAIRAIELYLSYRYGKPRNLVLSEIEPMVIRVIREDQLTPIP